MAASTVPLTAVTAGGLIFTPPPLPGIGRPIPSSRELSNTNATRATAPMKKAAWCSATVRRSRSVRRCRIRVSIGLLFECFQDGLGGNRDIDLAADHVEDGIRDSR